MKWINARQMLPPIEYSGSYFTKTCINNSLWEKEVLSRNQIIEVLENGWLYVYWLDESPSPAPSNVQYAEGEDDIAFDFHKVNEVPAPSNDDKELTKMCMNLSEKSLAKEWDEHNIEDAAEKYVKSLGFEYYPSWSSLGPAFKAGAGRQASQKEDIVSAAIELLNLHMAEQEGLLSGMPTREQWLIAVDNLSNAIYKPPIKEQKK